MYRNIFLILILISSLASNCSNKNEYQNKNLTQTIPQYPYQLEEYEKEILRKLETQVNEFRIENSSLEDVLQLISTLIDVNFVVDPTLRQNESKHLDRITFKSKKKIAYDILHEILDLLYLDFYIYKDVVFVTKKQMTRKTNLAQEVLNKICDVKKFIAEKELSKSTQERFENTIISVEDVSFIPFEVLKKISQDSDISVSVHPALIEKFTKPLPLKSPIKNISAKTFLDVLSFSLDVSYYLEGSTIFITTREEYQEKLNSEVEIKNILNKNVKIKIKNVLPYKFFQELAISTKVEVIPEESVWYIEKLLNYEKDTWTLEELLEKFSGDLKIRYLVEKDRIYFVE